MLALEMAVEVQKHINLLQSFKSVPRQQLQMEARLNRQLINLFGSVSNEVLRELRRHGRTPSNDTTRRAIVRMVEEAGEAFQRLISEGAVDAAQYGRNRILTHLQRAGISIDMSRLMEFPDTAHRLIREHAFVASDRTLNRIVGDVVGNLAISYEEGLGIDDAAQRLEREFQHMKDFELRRVARTEIQSFQNEGAHMTMDEMGVEFEQWWTADDDRVRGIDPIDRADHISMHGQITRLGEAFSNGLYYPGDRSGGEGTIHEWINCRCRVVPFIMPSGMMAPDTQWFYEQDLIAV